MSLGELYELPASPASQGGRINTNKQISIIDLIKLIIPKH